jgi:hypothetical protein
MKTALKVVGGVLLVGAIAGGSYAAGAVFQPPDVRIVTETNEVEVPGPVRWKTKSIPFVPAACSRAVEAGNDMAEIVDDYGNEVVTQYDRLVGDFESLVVDTYNMVDDAYNAGVGYDGFGPISNNLDQIEGRRDDLIAKLEDAREADNDLWQTWDDTPWYAPADACTSKA